MEQSKIEKVINNIDWELLHKYYVKDFGMNIEIYENGSISLLTSSTYTKNAVAVIKTEGGNFDNSYYTEDFAEEIDDSDSENYGKWKILGLWGDHDSKEFLSYDDMIERSITDGDHSDRIEEWENEIREQMEQNNEETYEWDEE